MAAAISGDSRRRWWVTEPQGTSAKTTRRTAAGTPEGVVVSGRALDRARPGHPAGRCLAGDLRGGADATVLFDAPPAGLAQHAPERSGLPTPSSHRERAERLLDALLPSREGGSGGAWIETPRPNPSRASGVSSRSFSSRARVRMCAQR